MNCCGSSGFRKPIARTTGGCPDRFGCVDGVSPDFVIKRHDVVPAFIVSVSDCDGPLDLTDCVVEASMWAKAKLKSSLAATDVSFSLADDIGFEQSLVGDVIVVSRVRSPEFMLVVGHDESSKTISVLRGYQGTTPAAYLKGTRLRLFRMLNSTGEPLVLTESVEQIDGTTQSVVTDSQLVYNWKPSNTCLPGCYYFEFKLLKISDVPVVIDDVVPSNFSVACSMGYAVEWVRRFPVDGDGFLIRIFDSPTSEALQV